MFNLNHLRNQTLNFPRRTVRPRIGRFLFLVFLSSRQIHSGDPLWRSTLVAALVLSGQIALQPITSADYISRPSGEHLPSVLTGQLNRRMHLGGLENFIFSHIPSYSLIFPHILFVLKWSFKCTSWCRSQMKSAHRSNTQRYKESQQKF